MLQNVSLKGLTIKDCTKVWRMRCKGCKIRCKDLSWNVDMHMSLYVVVFMKVRESCEWQESHGLVCNNATTYCKCWEMTREVWDELEWHWDLRCEVNNLIFVVSKYIVYIQ